MGHTPTPAELEVTSVTGRAAHRALMPPRSSVSFSQPLSDMVYGEQAAPS